MRPASSILVALLALGGACGDDATGHDASMDARSVDAARPDSAADAPALDAPGEDIVAVDVGPGTDAGPGLDSGPGTDAEAPADTGPLPDAGPPPDFPASWPRSRGWNWVRSQEVFISALTTRMGPPPASAVARYYDEFGATASHTWLLSVPDVAGAWMAARPAGRWLGWLDNAGNSPANGMLVGGSTPAGRIGYQIGDEPRSTEALNEMLAGMRRVQSADPEGLRVINFTNNDGTPDFMRAACASGVADVFSMSRYTLGNRAYNTLAELRDGAQACGIPHWRYLKAYLGERGEQLQSTSDLRWEAFLGLLYGTTGHTWFLYNVADWEAEYIPSTLFEEPGRWDSAVTPRFGIIAQINRELLVYGRAQTRLRSTGLGYLAAEPFPILRPPQGIRAWTPGTGGDGVLAAVRPEGDQDIALGFYDDRYGDSYVMVMNPNHTQGGFGMSSERDAVVHLDFDFAGEAGLRNDRILVLRPTGRVEAVPVSGGSVTFTIAAGDIVFYKYDSGRPFEGY